MDFSKLGAPKQTQQPIDPIKIFERLPNLPGTPNDLWRGQAEALAEWHGVRKNKDVLVSLNTGAGKTLVGLLAAQSLVNEGVENVVYVCATIDLVNQTSEEARQIGLDHTTRVRGGFDNDLFESGRGFCITTYHALFNGLSAIRSRYFPGAVIFDDAHVAETILRSALTLRVSLGEHSDLFREVAELFRDHFKELRIEGRFEDSLTPEHGSIVMVAPGGLLERRDRLIALLEAHGTKTDDNLKYVYAHLRDKIDCCSMFFSRGSFELAPPFLPSLALDVFERPVRRIYLSATLRSKTDIVRAFGRLPDVTIEPDNDAGNGERLILFGRTIPDGISFELIASICKKRKTLIAVPNYPAAQAWADIAEPPEPYNFSSALNSFRDADNGAFVLVSRVDGIDLPHDTCRLMVLDGLPSGTSLTERYQWAFLQMVNVHATRLANRLAQLFGRINRGRNDYGVFLVSGNELNAWLNKDRNVALLPPLLQRQVLLGRAVQEGMNLETQDEVKSAIEAVISRDPSWLVYYRDNIQSGDLDEEQVARVENAEDQMLAAAEAEAIYAAAMWTGDASKARRALDESIEATGRIDALLSGWHNVWLGAAYEYEKDVDSAYLAYRRAISRLGSMLALPRGAKDPGTAVLGEDASTFARGIDQLVGLTSDNAFKKEYRRFRLQLLDLDGATPGQMEESVRVLGELLGFTANRPDNDVGTGPDVLWMDEATETCLAIELKTDKKNPATYWKKDIAQGHDHLAWVRDSYGGYSCLGLLIVGPDGTVEARANPSASMWHSTPPSFVELRDQLLAMISDIRSALPLERPGKTREACDEETWKIGSLFERLRDKPLRDMDVVSK